MLAWIRTGLAMMGFGFVVARFGLFLRELEAVQDRTPHHSGLVSLSVGVSLVLLGVVVNVLAGLQHAQFLKRLNRGEAYVPPRWSLEIIVAGVLAVIGLTTAIYLLATG